MSVPNGIWDKPGPLSAAEWERVRLHAYDSERILCQSPLLAPLARAAGTHHERLDGSGYHRGDAAALRNVSSRVLAAGHAPGKIRASWPAELTEREVQVLRVVALGRSNKEAARALGISPRTVQRHLLHIDPKIGVSTRAGATLFAMENDLLRREG